MGKGRSKQQVGSGGEKGCCVVRERKKGSGSGTREGRGRDGVLEWGKWGKVFLMSRFCFNEFMMSL